MSVIIGDSEHYRLLGYLEEAMKQIDRLCDVPAPTKDAKARIIIEIQRIASASIERAKQAP